MTRAAYLLSKDAEVLLAPYVQLLLGEDHPPEISSPAFATPWDYRFGDLFLDLKLACKARIYGQISDQTLADVRKSLESGVLVAIYVPPKLYLLTPSDLPFLARGLPVEMLEAFPHVFVDQKTGEEVWKLYESMLTS